MHRFLVPAVALALLVTLPNVVTAVAANPPNVVVLLTDDQDLELGGLKPLKNLRRLVTEQGTMFTNAFVHTPICCPSRSSYLSGRYIHNGGALNNSVAGNCAGPVWHDGPEQRTFAVHAHAAGYVTSYAGKYLNQ